MAAFIRVYPCPSVVKNMARILIIEDETPMRTALKDVIEAEGYRALTAADGESGLKRALEEKPTSSSSTS